MKFCQHCGKEIMDEAVVCPGCGCAVKTNNAQETEVDQSVSGGLVVLAVLIPLFGIIYWPVKAKACGIAALISWAVGFVFMMAMGGM